MTDFPLTAVHFLFYVLKCDLMAWLSLTIMGHSLHVGGD